MMDLKPWRKPQTTEHPASLFREEFDRLFERFFSDPWGGEFFRSGSAWTPALDVSENENEIIIALEIPGVDPKEMNISVSNNILNIRGEKKEENKDENKNFYYAERRFGSFQRTIELPNNVDADSISAKERSGVIEIAIKKIEPTQSRRVPVMSAKH